MASKPIMSWSAGLLVALSTFSGAFAVVLVAVKLVAEEVDAPLVPVSGLSVGGAPALSTTQFFPDEATIDSWRKGECEVGRPVPDVGRVEEFLRPFERCARGEEKVRVRFSGYASSSLAGGLVEDFGIECRGRPGLWRDCLDAQGCKPADSAEERRACIGKAFNLCVANERGRRVALAVREQMAGSAEWLDVSERKWPSYECMAENRSVEDRPKGRYKSARGAVNRHVRLEVVGTGRCLVAATKKEDVGVESAQRAWARRELDCMDCLLPGMESASDCGGSLEGPGICPLVGGWMTALSESVSSSSRGNAAQTGEVR